MDKKLPQSIMERLVQQKMEPYFKEKGYSFYHQYHNCLFRCVDDHMAEQFEIQSTSSGIGYTEHMLSFFEVERIVFENGMPGQQLNEQALDRFLTRQDLYRTVWNSKMQSQLDFTYQRPAKTEVEIVALTQSIINYMKGPGHQFRDRYTHLPSVLEEMNRLQSEGKYWHEIIGSPGWIFRGLIISKLCNDSEFLGKKLWVDNLFKNPENGLEPDMPYYQKLLTILEETKPLYNTLD